MDICSNGIVTSNKIQKIEYENKGFKIYKLINDLVGKKEWAEKLEFTYIGNMSDEYSLNNTNLVNPLAGLELAAEIKKHQIYVTASINEPSGNHHIEAAQCGLPIIYLESGGIPEYCEGYGLSFDNNFEKQFWSNRIFYHNDCIGHIIIIIFYLQFSFNVC